MYEDLNGFSFVYLDKSKPGAILREQRVTQNMTQRQVAEKAKITIRQYQTFESNQRNLRRNLRNLHELNRLRIESILF